MVDDPGVDYRNDDAAGARGDVPRNRHIAAAGSWRGLSATRCHRPREGRSGSEQIPLSSSKERLVRNCQLLQQDIRLGVLDRRIER